MSIFKDLHEAEEKSREFELTKLEPTGADEDLMGHFIQARNMIMTFEGERFDSIIDKLRDHINKTEAYVRSLDDVYYDPRLKVVYAQVTVEALRPHEIVIELLSYSNGKVAHAKRVPVTALKVTDNVNSKHPPRA